MTYRVYSGPKGSADVSPLEKSQLLFKELHTLDEALLGRGTWSILAGCHF